MVNCGGQWLVLLLEINWQIFHLHNVRRAGFATSRKLNSKSATPLLPPLPIKKGQKGMTMGGDKCLLIISTKQWNGSREEESVLETVEKVFCDYAAARW